MKLLVELDDVPRFVRRSSRFLDQFKECFLHLQSIHREHDLRQLYRDLDFPDQAGNEIATEGTNHGQIFHLGGYLAKQADIDVQFIWQGSGWALHRIGYM